MKRKVNVEIEIDSAWIPTEDFEESQLDILIEVNINRMLRSIRDTFNTTFPKDIPDNSCGLGIVTLRYYVATFQQAELLLALK